jgi:hypothetical protein
MKKGVSALFLFSMILIHGSATTALAGWEAGTVIGFDTNVDRSIDGGKSDGFLVGHLGFARTPTGERRWGVTMSATLEGAAYAKNSDLDYVAVTGSPGIVFVPHALWTVAVTPFLQAKGVRDADQSAIAFGGKASIEERILRNLYLGQYYAYTDSRADVDTFSFSEHSVGAYIGMVATSALHVELGYEFTRGDSFRTLGTSASTPPGSGMHRRFSAAFGSDVVREDVDRHAVFLSVAMDWTPSLFSRAGYTFTDTEGDLGSSLSHSGFAGVGYRF